MANPSMTLTRISHQAMALMQQLSVPPTPKNYSVFFACAQGEPPELLAEIERLIAHAAPVSPAVLDQLYERYIIPHQHSATQDSTVSARRILSEIAASIAELAGSTDQASASVSAQLALLNQDAVDEKTLRTIADAVIVSARGMKQSSEMASQKLHQAEREVTQLRENLNRITEEAARDFLTGCHNRKMLDRTMATLMDELAKAPAAQASLLMLDVDHFKLFNDNFGHAVGDEVLRIVAKCLTDSVKGMDTVARIGGEEFAVLLPNTPIAGGRIVAENIRKMIAGRELKRRSTGESYGSITVSVGVAAWHSGSTAEEWIARADALLYQAKHAGRNRVVCEAPAAS